jgi:hypothetical protein
LAQPEPTAVHKQLHLEFLLLVRLLAMQLLTQQQQLHMLLLTHSALSSWLFTMAKPM